MGTATNPECFVLSWQDFSSNIVSTLQDIREQEDFYDVTLACDEEHIIQSHKVILSASSPYFRGILKRSPAQNPVLLMPPGVRFRELSSLIDFIYNGKVQIASEDLNSFLALAKQFKIKGLTEDTPVGKVLPTPKPAQQAKTLPKFPPGIQMVRRGPQPNQQQQAPPQPIPKGVKRGSTADHENATPFKHFHAGDGARVVEDNVDDDENEDDVAMGDEDIPDDAENYFDDYEETDYGDYDYDETGTPIPHTQGPLPQGGAAASGGLQLTGLLCPQCRTLCHGVDALKEHMAKAHGMQQHSQPQKAPSQQQQQQQPSQIGGSSKEVSETPIICHICDKTFKSHRYMIAHQKRLHQIEPERKIGKGNKPTGRPKKKKEEDGDEESQYDPPVSVAKPILLGPSIMRSSMASQGGPKKDAKNSEPVGPGGSTPVQRQPNLGARPLPQGEQFLMSDGVAMPGPSRRLPQPGGRLPPGAGTIISRAGPSAVATVHPIDIKSLNHKLGGQISISSSDPSGSKARRPLPSSTAQSAYGVTNDGLPMLKGDSVRSGPSNRPQPVQASHLKEAASIEELDVVDDDEDFEGEEEYDETQYGEDCEDGGEYDDDGVGHPGMEMSDSVDGMYGEEHYEDEEEEDDEENH